MSVEVSAISGVLGTPQETIFPVFALPPINEIVMAIIFVAITLFVAVIVIKLIQRTIKKALERKDINPDMKYLAVKAVSWIGWFFVILWILIQFGQQELISLRFLEHHQKHLQLQNHSQFP